MDAPEIEDRLADYVRALRRRADASQREMAVLAKVSLATIVGLEAGRAGDVRVSTLARLARAGACRVALVDGGSGELVEPYPRDVPVDAGWRSFPAHLDLRKWREPTYWVPPHGPWTFDRDRAERDRRRAQ